MSEKEREANASEKTPQEFDDVLAIIGEFGLWQKLLFFWASLIGIMSGLNTLAQVFMAGESDHWCRVAAWNETNCTATGQPDDWECLVAKRNASIPLITNPDGDMVYDSCNMYDVRQLAFTPGMNATDYTTETISCSEADGWVYDTRQYKTTIINEVRRAWL